MKKNLSPRYFYLPALLIIVILAGCDDDPDPKDAEIPVITIISPAIDDVLYGNVDIKAEVTDNGEIQSVKVFIDNQTESLEEFDGAAVDFIWNTNGVSDGKHTLRFVATDVTGNKAEALLQLEIRNTLLTYAVPAAGIVEEKEFWILISDDSGKVLDYKELKNNATYTFKATPDYHGQDINLTILMAVTLTWTEEKQFQLYTYVHTPLRDYEFSDPWYSDDEPFNPIGSAHVLIADAPATPDYMYYLFGSPSYGAFQGPITYSQVGEMGPDDQYGTGVDYEFMMNHTESGVLQSRADGDDVLYMYTPLTVGQTHTRYISDFKKAGMKAVEVPDATQFGFSMVGKNEKGEYYYGIFGPEPKQVGGTINVPTIDEIFDSYRTGIGWLHDDKNVYYTYTFEGATPPDRVKEINASLTYTMNNNVLDYNLAGVCDVVHFYKTRVPGSVRMYWDVYAGPGHKTVVMPTPPQALVDMYGLMTFGQLKESPDNAHVVSDFAEYNGYDEYIDRSIQSLRPTKEYTTVQYYVPYTSRRQQGTDESFSQRIRSAIRQQEREPMRGK